MNNISVLVLTKNEQANIGQCLKSVAWSDDIHVFDSMSTDRTVDIAETYGAKVTKRAFDNWSTHQNWALKNLPFKHPWVFYIDADERTTPELVAEIQSMVAAPGGKVAFRIQRRDFYLGRWLRHVQASPFYIRLFKPEKVRYERLVNPISIVDGEVGQLSGFLDHFPFSKGVGHWLERHNSYSSFEARQILNDRNKGQGFSLLKAFRAPDFHERRCHQKELFYRMPFRPVLKFLLLYIAKRGFLDGKAGFAYALLQAIYEYFIVLKVRELETETRIQDSKLELSH